MLRECVLYLSFWGFVLSAPAGDGSVDLSYVISNGIPVWYGLSSFTMDILLEPNLGDFILQTENIHFPSHLGTHICAPIHLLPDGITVDQIPESNLQGPAVVIDVTEKTAENMDYGVTVQDLQDFESANGAIPDGAIVLIRTGWGKYWEDKAKYLGAEDLTDFKDARHPGLTSEAATWLVSERNIVGVGSDTISVDPGKDVHLPSFKTIFGANKYALVNLANLDLLPATGVTVYVLPVKIRESSGSPARVIAFIS